MPPSTIVDTIAQNLDKVESIFVCTMEDGEPVLYASGNLRELCIASIAIQQLAMQYINKEIVDE